MLLLLLLLLLPLLLLHLSTSGSLTPINSKQQPMNLIAAAIKP
jgi:hypothetical protein